MNYNTIKYFSTVNGDGVRTAVFVSGCNIHCPGCFNKKAQDFDYGKPLDDEVIERVLTSIDKPYISGLSILGGEPLDERNLQGVSWGLNVMVTFMMIIQTIATIFSGIDYMKGAKDLIKD